MTDPLPTEEFLTSLTTLLSSTHSAAHGSIYLTQKPLYSDTSSSSTTQHTSHPPSPSAQPTKILIRATNGYSKKHRTDKKLKVEKPKVKLSTTVEVDELETFYVRYAEVCKKGMEGLRKRDRKAQKGKKAKTKKKGKGSGGGEKVAAG